MVKISREGGFSVLVYVRIRPPQDEDDEEEQDVVSYRIKNSQQLFIKNTEDSFKSFRFDYVFPPYEDFCQQSIYENLARPMLFDALKGYNACILAYGHTNSGKTYSITGTEAEPGIIPRIVDDLFAQINVHKSQGKRLLVSYSNYEIYNEKIYDLLADDASKKTSKLRIREHPVTGPYVKGLTINPLTDVDNVFRVMRRATTRKSVGFTKFNAQSSRSHCICTFYISISEYTCVDASSAIENVHTSQFNIVDLAGSERSSELADAHSSRFKESLQINKSLFTLGKVIAQLSERQSSSSGRPSMWTTESTPLRSINRREVDEVHSTPRTKVARQASPYFVSYRDSVLTWLLKESLGGNAKTAMLATVNPATVNYEETLRTLRYAQMTQRIINTAKINEDSRGKLVRDLLDEVARLKEELCMARNPSSPYSHMIRDLQHDLDQRNEEIEQLTRQLDAFALGRKRSGSLSSESTQTMRSRDSIISSESDVDGFSSDDAETLRRARVPVLDVAVGGETILDENLADVTVHVPGGLDLRDAMTSPVGSLLSPEKLQITQAEIQRITDKMTSLTQHCVDMEYDLFSRDKEIESLKQQAAFYQNAYRRVVADLERVNAVLASSAFSCT